MWSSSRKLAAMASLPTKSINSQKKQKEPMGKVGFSEIFCYSSELLVWVRRSRPRVQREDKVGRRWCTLESKTEKMVWFDWMVKWCQLCFNGWWCWWSSAKKRVTIGTATMAAEPLWGRRRNFFLFMTKMSLPNPDIRPGSTRDVTKYL